MTMDAETARQERIMGIRRIVRQIKADIAAKRERKEVKHVPPYRRLPHGCAGVCADNAMRVGRIVTLVTMSFAPHVKLV